jgi:LAO/AO transport system kinase
MALQMQREIRSMLEMLRFDGWIPELVATQALSGAGIDALWAAIAAHDTYLKTSGEIARKRRAAFAHRVRALALGALERRIDEAIERVADGRDPYAAARDVLAGFGIAGELARSGYSRARGKAHASVKGL